MGGWCIQCGYTGQRDDSHPNQDGLDCVEFHSTIQIRVQQNTHKLVSYEIFHLIFLGHAQVKP